MKITRSALSFAITRRWSGGMVSVCCNGTVGLCVSRVAGGITAGQAVPAGNSINGWAMKVLVV